MAAWWQLTRKYRTQYLNDHSGTYVHPSLSSAAAARTGFAHKYPYAYDNMAAQQTHKKSATELLNGARNARSQKQVASSKLQRGK
jgi:hypothetical protein